MKEYIDFAREGLKLGEYEYSAEICKMILFHKPRYVEARRVLQVALKKLYNKRSTIGKIIGRMISYVYFLLGFFLGVRKGREWIDKGIWSCPSNKIGLMLLGQRALKNKDFDTLIFVYEELSLLCPDEVKYGLALGSTYFYVKDYKNALRVGEELLIKDISNMEVMDLIERATLAQMMDNSLV